MKNKCGYCEPKEYDKYGNGTGEYIEGLDKNSGMWFYMTNGKHILRAQGTQRFKQILPKYCPMCGRKINVTD